MPSSARPRYAFETAIGVLPADLTMFLCHPQFREFYNQAQLFYNSMSEVEQQEMVQAATFELGHCDDRGVQERMVARFAEIDVEFAKAIASGFDIDVPEPKHKNHGKRTDGALPISMLSKNNTFTVEGRKIAIMALDGFDGLQAEAMQAAFSAMGVIVHIVGMRKGPAYPRGVKVGDRSAPGVLHTNFPLEGCRSTFYDALFFPDGDEAYQKTLKTGRVIHFVRESYGHYKALAAAGAAVPWVAHTCLPGSLDIKADQGETFSSKNGVVLGPNVTSDEASAWKKLTKGVKDASSFASAFADAVAAHRHWGRDVSGVAF